MRLAFLSYEFPPAPVGGIATYAKHAVRMLAARGHEVLVFAGSADGAAREESFHGARVFRLPCADRQAFASIAVPALVAAHRRAPFDAAEVPDLYAEGAGLRAAAPDLPFIVRAHTPLYIAARIDFEALPAWARVLSAARRLAGGVLRFEKSGALWREAASRASFRRQRPVDHDPERRVALEADLVVPPSRRLAERLRRDWMLPADRVRLLPYPHFPAPELEALAPPTEARVIAFHGGVRRFKGVHVLAEAIPLVLARHPDVRFVIAGASGSSPVPDLSPRAWLSDRTVVWRDTAPWLASRLAPFADRVEWTGFVPPDRLAGHLARADLCVFPSLFDNFPSACLEAMSAARPVVATRSGGMAEMLGENDSAGLLVPPGDARSLADALCRLIEQPALRARLALAARRRVAELCDPGSIGPLHEELLREAIALRRSSLARPA